MIRPGNSAPRLPHVLLLLLFLLALAAGGEADAAESAPFDCRADQLRKAKVSAVAEFQHRGQDYSIVRSTTDVDVPADWAHASALLLDRHSPDYRAALRCLVGKPLGEQRDFRDFEWRFKPVSVRAEADSHLVKVHHEAATWFQYSAVDAVGPWVLTVTKKDWRIALRPPPALKAANWDSVRVDLGGRGALTAAPPPTFGAGGTSLSWQHPPPDRNPTVTFRPPAAQHWSFITTSSEDTWRKWEVWGVYSASGAFWYVASGALLLVAGRRMRRGLAGKTMPEESRALGFLRWCALLLMFLGLLVYLGDNLYALLDRLVGWQHDYAQTVSVFSLAAMGLALCFLGSRSTRFRLVVGVLVLGVLEAYAVSEVYDLTLLPTADRVLSGAGWTATAVASTVLMAVCWLGVIVTGQRVLLMGETRIPVRVMAVVAGVAAVATVLWSYLAFNHSWDRISWLADPTRPEFRVYREITFSSWWWQLPTLLLEPLLSIVGTLAPLAVLGVLRVCRVERYEKASFTPEPAEMFLLVVLFAITFAPITVYYGFSGYAFTLLLTLLTAWGVLVLGSSRSVMEQPFSDNAPLGRTIQRTDRADVLRLARRFRDLQSRLGHLGSVSPAERSAERESIEAEIDRLDQSLPPGVRPADLPFACGPMPTWWGNARRGAVIACLFGLPATGLLYWTEAVKGDSWAVYVQDASGFVWILNFVLYWQVAWIVAGFFLGALWRDLPGRHGPTKALFVALAFALPTAADFLITQALGESAPQVIGEIAAFGSVMTCTGLMMDLQTFQKERQYWPTNASLVAYVYQMRFASVAFFLAQLLALATLWKTLAEAGPAAPGK
ncbi:DUF6185 family protein [Streptomyces sp. NPDC094032]|uniref:DUF6185 family protein n=1 Tax=Streptomyces sp. NPDC094032 TaxID=3155308 RepID=UPI0033180553